MNSRKSSEQKSTYKKVAEPLDDEMAIGQKSDEPADNTIIFGIDARSAFATIVILVATIGLLWFMADLVTRSSPQACNQNERSIFYLITISLEVINVVLLLVLIAQYVRIYSRLQSEFTLGLIVFAYVLLANSLFTNPLLFTSQTVSTCSGVLSFVPAFFTTIAAAILLYLNST